MKFRKFVDTCIVHATGGNGGNGCVSMRREKYVPCGGPDGGDGGDGGSVVLQADRNSDSLIDLFYAPLLHAQDGGKGSGQKSAGRNGTDRVVMVPCGTEIWPADGGFMIADLVSHGDRMVVARGGKGGKGNHHWKGTGHLALSSHTDGEPGESFDLRIELKIVADVGLVGFPNAGKSSLLGAITDAHPKIAAYPFTTLNPIVGTMVFEDYSRIRVADMPGLIEGAHDGVGLGHAFLRHIERSKCLAYVLDMAGTDGRDPVQDYRKLRNELKLHDKRLPNRPAVIIANKMDLPAARINLKRFTRLTRKKPIAVSALVRDGVREAQAALKALVTKPPAAGR